LRIGYFPGQWKVSQIIPILKPGKPAEEVMSYRPISLLPILSRLFEILFLTRIQPILHKNGLYRIISSVSDRKTLLLSKSTV
jgi:hypothetical protein